MRVAACEWLAHLRLNVRAGYRHRERVGCALNCSDNAPLAPAENQEGMKYLNWTENIGHAVKILLSIQCSIYYRVGPRSNQLLTPGPNLSPKYLT